MKPRFHSNTFQMQNMHIENVQPIVNCNHLGIGKALTIMAIMKLSAEQIIGLKLTRGKSLLTNYYIGESLTSIKERKKSKTDILNNG